MSKKDFQSDNQNEDSGGFSFEPLPAGDEASRTESFAQEEKLRESLAASGKAPKGKSSFLRLLLVVLLIVALAGAGAYFYMGMEEEPPPVPVAVKKVPVAPPPKPAPAKEVVKKAPEQPKEVAKAEQPTVAQVTPSQEAAPPVAVPEPVQQKEDKTLPVAGKSGGYSVQAGAFLLKSNLERSKEKIRKLGYVPIVKIRQKEVQMVRLRVGAYPVREANDKLENVKKYAPDAYMVKEGNLHVIYAGTYHDLDKARSFSDRLYEKGVIIEEETVMLPQPLHVLSFGEFTELDSARKAANKAREIGMDVFVSKIK